MADLKATIAESLHGAVAHTEGQRLTLPPNHPALVANGLASGTDVTLCQYWPIAKPVILSLQHYLPSWCAWIVNILISVGDKACPGV